MASIFIDLQRLTLEKYCIGSYSVLSKQYIIKDAHYQFIEPLLQY